MTQTALVTGAGSGIGRQAALALAQAGFAVIVCGRRQSALDETVALHPCADHPVYGAAANAGAGSRSSEAASPTITAMVCDVTDSSSVDALFTGIEMTHGRLDVVFNNAGTNVPPAPIDELSVADFQSVIDVNITGAFRIARGAFALMRRQAPQGGRIINNGSISAYLPRPGSVPYTMSKHAISGLTKTLSLDGRPFDIACGQIDIGNTASAMTEKMNAGVPQADGSIRAEPTMDTRHVADAVVNMARLPLSANVQNMTIMATKMPFVGRG